MKYDCLRGNERFNDGSSITTLIIIFLFPLKFWIHSFAQMSQISNRSFLHIQCMLLDYFLRIFIHMDQWLNACVACERAITVVKGARFIITTFQFFASFIINFNSAFILIAQKPRRQSTIQRKRNFKDISKENCREHKHLFIALAILVILALPRLIISFTSKCMQSSKDSWLFLSAYLISLIPSNAYFHC
ncbi:unnamed protein product, partial [Adineta steineri]